MTSLDYQLLHGLNQIAPVNIGNGTAVAVWDSTIYIKTNDVTGSEERHTGQANRTRNQVLN